MVPLKLLLIRHGQSQGNVDGRLEGWHSTPLTTLGQQQALALGQRLAKTDWDPTHIYCSPLLRATATLASMLAGFTGQSQAMPVPLPNRIPLRQGFVPIQLREDLKELNQGIFNGLTWAEAQTIAPDLCHHLETNLDWHPIPQAETPAQGYRRAQHFVDHLLGQHRNGDRVWVISHHGLLQQILACLMGCDRPWGLAIGHTALFEFWLDRDRWHDPGPNRFNTALWQIKRWNHSDPVTKMD
ncbi:MAG: histidine phosphatase family protein [Leptolyngbya sp. LCM1.Bin17]|nr:MAG: histidine phosphatase family protein [Leptolyngbya sp. LCM1.Bin17]